jgi:uncharacterized membrane protein YgcG
MDQDQIAAAGQIAEEARQQAESSKFPFFSGDPKKDQFTAEQWIERVERAKKAAGWSDRKVASYLYNAFRDDALTWFRNIQTHGIDSENWEEVKEFFLIAYGTASTAKIIVTDFRTLVQGKNETVTQFSNRVGETTTNYIKHIPAGGLGHTIPVLPDDHPWSQFTAAQKQQVLNMHGVDQQNRHVLYMGAQLFISGLRTDLRLEVVKKDPQNFKEAYLAARETERNLATKDKETIKVNELDDIEDPEDRAEIEALRRQQQQRKMFKAGSGSAYQSRSYQPSGNNSGGYSSGSAGASSGAIPKRTNPAFGKTCHYCKKKNHFQTDCHKRKRDNAPLVKVQELEGEDGPIETVYFKNSKN